MSDNNPKLDTKRDPKEELEVLNVPQPGRGISDGAAEPLAELSGPETPNKSSRHEVFPELKKGPDIIDRLGSEYEPCILDQIVTAIAEKIQDLEQQLLGALDGKEPENHPELTPKTRKLKKLRNFSFYSTHQTISSEEAGDEAIQGDPPPGYDDNESGKPQQIEIDQKEENQGETLGRLKRIQKELLKR